MTSQALTQEEKRVRIAEACGWTKCRLTIKGAGGGTRCPTAHGFPPGRNYEADCPNYFRCLNAIHEAWKTLTNAQKFAFKDKLQRLLLAEPSPDTWLIAATAAQRAEAFGLTLNLWDDRSGEGR